MIKALTRATAAAAMTAIQTAGSSAELRLHVIASTYMLAAAVLLLLLLLGVPQMHQRLLLMLP
jgi:hypothetical protein